MKRLLILVSLITTCSMVSAAGNRSNCKTTQKDCCPTATGSTNSGCGTQWYKAKDGTFREMLTYPAALSRAEDADDMEIRLKDVQTQLETAHSEVETVKADAVKLQAELESRIAELKQQLEKEQQAVVAQKERGDKAEAAHKQSVEQVAALRDSEKKNEESRTAVESELKKVAEERDVLKTAKVDLEKALSDMTAAKTSAEEAAKQSQKELEKVKQDAAESKKSEVQAEPKKDDAPEPEPDAPGDDAPKN